MTKHNETVLLLAMRSQRNIDTKITKLEKISTTVSDKAEATHQQDSDTDCDKTSKYAAERYNSATMIYQ